MPGLSQLKKLSEQILKLGNEINVRAERGEKAVPYPVPDTIPDVDDSDDFLDGMPKKPGEIEEEVVETSASEGDANSDDGLDSLFSGIPGDADQLDLSAFGEEPGANDGAKKDEPPPKPKGIDGSGYSGFGYDDEGNLELSGAEENQFDIDALMGGPGKKSTLAEGLTGIPELDAILNPQEKAPPAEEPAPAESVPPMEEFFAPMEELVPNEKAASAETPSEDAASPDNVLDEPLSLDDIPDFSAEEETPSEEAALPDAVLDEALSLDDAPDFPAEEEMPSEAAPSSDEFDLPEPEENAAPLQDDSFDLGGEDSFMAGFDTLPDLDNAEGGSLDAQDNFEMPGQNAQGGTDSADGESLPEQESADNASPAAEDSALETPDAPSSDDGGINFEDLGIDGLEVEDYSPPPSANASPSVEDSSSEKTPPPSEEPPAKKAESAFEDFGIDGLEIEEYTPTESATPAPNVSVDSIFGESSDETEDFKPEEEKPKPKVVHKLLSIEDDIAILKPDIFTDNPVTSANPPYYVTSEFGKLPEMPEEESEPSESPAKPASSGGDDFSLDGVEEYEAAPSNDGGLDNFSVDSFDMDNPGTGEEEKPSDGEDIFAGVDEYQKPEETAEQPFSADNIFAEDFDMDSPGAEPFSVDASEVAKDDAPPDFGDMNFNMDEDFSLDGSESSESSFEDFNIPDTDAQLDQAKNDFALDDDFSIPGFSEDDADPYAKKEKGGLDQVDFSNAVTGDGKHRNSLNEEEYKRFKKNLKDYPLNVRIAVEDMIVKNEFTDEVTFELIDKILKKVTARQLANYLEKMLDISLQVPRDFEKRTAEEYEAYKASFAYQLKSKILPALLAGTVCAMLLLCIGYLGHRYIYKPLKAESLYKEGYSLLEHDEYPQSEIKFNEALTYKSKKKWFFKYARGYREHRQYDMAELFYKNILKRFNHDKQAGLEYARMELEDLGEYEKTEEILKREVLDWHVNDPDGILALGDTYLEWATEKDPSKFDDAFETYSLLARLHGDKNPDLYQSRLLRYYIRTDQLRNVLELKEFFFPREKSLSASDWTELCGYLLDKLYGELPRDQEFLRGRIEDLRDMLLFAIKADPENPIASYNLSRYLVEVGDHDKALRALEETERLFDRASNLKNRDIRKQVDSYRLFGEEYLYDREWLKAREKLTNGIEIFEKRARQTNFEGDKNVGLLYYDMGNLEYFISGDLDSAYRNYRNSIENKYDTPAIRYRLGYIDYSKQDYTSALNSFLKVPEYGHLDSHSLLALANTLSLRNDNFAAQSYYNRLISYLDFQREKYGISIPQIDGNAGDIVETYMKASNNLGVSLFRVARQSGNSSMNAESLVNFQNSIRYYDALTRNQETMVRLPGSNLAEQNLRYVTNPISDYEPAIYTEIPRVLDGEKGLAQ